MASIGQGRLRAATKNESEAVQNGAEMQGAGNLMRSGVAYFGSDANSGRVMDARVSEWRGAARRY